MSGLPRQQLLATAFQQGQSGRVVAAFRGFLAYQAANGGVFGGVSSGASRVNGAATPGSTLESNSPTAQIDLASLAAPGRAKSGQTEIPPDKGVVTRKEIADFYRDVTTGKYNGRDNDKAAIELQIQEAMREGRIR